MAALRQSAMAVAFLAFVGGCEPSDAPPLEPASREAQVYHGVYESAFETQAFHPDSGEGPWWFSAPDEVMDELTGRKGAAQAARIFFGAEVTVRGLLEDDGARFGPLGDYPAEFRATELLSYRILDIDETEALIGAYEVRNSGGATQD